MCELVECREYLKVTGRRKEKKRIKEQKLKRKIYQFSGASSQVRKLARFFRREFVTWALKASL